MNAEMVYAGIQLVAMTLSFGLLFKTRRLSGWLRTTESSYLRVSAGSDVGQSAI